MTAPARPINFTAAEVRAALAGEPVVKYRKVTPQPGPEYGFCGWVIASDNKSDIGKAEFCILDELHCVLYQMWIRCPFGPVGQRFWVRESLDLWPGSLCYSVDGEPVFIADWHWFENHEDAECKPKHMPRWASRYILTLTSIAVIQRDGWRWRGVFEVTK